jgi:hypothetical protein
VVNVCTCWAMMMINQVYSPLVQAAPRAGIAMCEVLVRVGPCLTSRDISRESCGVSSRDAFQVHHT